MSRSTISPAAQPQSLRYRKNSKDDRGRRPTFTYDPVASDSEDCYGKLDLSIHHPPSPSSELLISSDLYRRTDAVASNRFGPLAALPHAVTRDRAFFPSSPRRRTRNSRGTKKAKRRRDARSDGKKLAAQFLNEQLSREIDETLVKAGIHAPKLTNIAAPTPVLLTTSISMSPENKMLFKYTPSPPKLPPFNLSLWDMKDFPSPPTPRKSSPLVKPATFTGLPNWCPPISTKPSNGNLFGDRPKFWDLSHLPEPEDPVSAKKPCQQLELWKQPRKQSRFFPHPPVVAQAAVKLHPTSHKFHWIEQTFQGPLTSKPNAPSAPTLIDTAYSAIDQIVAAVQAEAEATSTTSELPSATNLWNILKDVVLEKIDLSPSSRDSSWDDEETGGVPLLVAPDDRIEERIELDGKELPYVHCNSLVGPANDVAAFYTTAHAETNALPDSAIYLVEASTPTEREEMTTMPWPLTPRSPPLSNLGSLASAPLIRHTPNIPPTNTDSDDLTRHEHFQSEQQLFEPVHLPPPRTPSDSTCDLEESPALDHVENCRCGDCDDAAVLVDQDRGATPLTEMEDGWITWPRDGRSDAWLSGSTAIPEDYEDDDQEYEADRMEVIHHHYVDGSEWEDLYACEPWPVLQPANDHLFGHWDDGTAISREESEEFDWFWAL